MSAIQKTMNYDRFKFIDGNRPVNSGRRKKIADNMKKNNLLHVCPIIVKKDGKFLNILDGQGRFEAAKMLGFPIHYIVTDALSEDLIGDFNSTNTNWKMCDYLEWYANKGKRDYIRLREFTNESKISNTLAAMILAGHSETEGGLGNNHRADFRAGKFKITNMDAGKKIALAINMLKSKGIKHYGHRGVIVAITKLLRTKIFDIDRLDKKLEYQTAKFVKCANYEQYIDIIDDIYNYHTSKKNIVSLSTAVKKL
jgi:hypothetical protein